MCTYDEYVRKDNTFIATSGLQAPGKYAVLCERAHTHTHNHIFSKQKQKKKTAHKDRALPVLCDLTEHDKKQGEINPRRAQRSHTELRLGAEQYAWGGFRTGR